MLQLYIYVASFSFCFVTCLTVVCVQSDNVVTQYLTDGNGNIVPFTTQNVNSGLYKPTPLINGSDNVVLTSPIAIATGCNNNVYRVPDQTNPGTSVPALALNEIQATIYQQVCQVFFILLLIGFV